MASSFIPQPPQTMAKNDNGDNDNRDNDNYEPVTAMTRTKTTATTSIGNRKMHEKGDEAGARRDADASRAPGAFFYSFRHSIPYYTNFFKILCYYHSTTATRGATSAWGSRRRRHVSSPRYVF